MSTVTYPHIEITADGHARIRGTGFKVRILAEEYLNGATPAELVEGHPQLSLAQVHGALAYYYDHQQAFDNEIAELRRIAEEMHASQGESLLLKKLRERGNASGGPVKLKTHGSGGLQPGVDLDNTAALLDLMDLPHAAS